MTSLRINANQRISQNTEQLNLFDRFHCTLKCAVHARLYLSSEFSKFSLVSFAPNTAQWLCSFPLSTHQLMGGCDTKQLWMVDRHDGRYLESPDLSGKLSASGLSASSHPAVPSSMSGGQPRTGSTGEASLSLPPPAPAWNRHTLLQQPTILVANLLQTPPNVQNISALGQKIPRLCCFVDC